MAESRAMRSHELITASKIPHCNRQGLSSVIETLLCIAEVRHNAGDALPLLLPFHFLLEDIRARPGTT